MKKDVLTLDGQNQSAARLESEITRLLRRMEAIDQSGHYAELIIHRSWSKHNPTISGEFSRPKVFAWYLKREIRRLLSRGARIELHSSRLKTPLGSPALLQTLDEDEWDFTRKKLFLFSPERIALSLDRLEHYTGTRAEDFQRYVIFTNYSMHTEVFQKRFPRCARPSRRGVQMPAYHHRLPDSAGVTLINIGVGPSNAKTCSDHVAVLRPDLMIMAGHCGGLRNHQDIGDYVLASGYMRADGIFDAILPQSVPLAPNHLLNVHLRDVLDHLSQPYRVGTVYTTANRNWEFARARTLSEIHVSRSIAIDMESATIAANGFRYRIPSATLLCVSDKPLHGKPKLSTHARRFYGNSKEKHIDVILRAIQAIKKSHPGGLPNDSLRTADEPLLGGT
ncbi:hypothetical protein QPK87_02015 [Kamptonema cortianum]|nr:hypothetical protein [Oscillatoria laete-virens]MDK3155361.1 hypothetical protein [Kamptonema cortianum]MDL5046110.1 hypothetical protein [Oscillatoria amoena NRMC-F 0135]MDL5052811.1 hypothetical protein [Oscillatoria laete-virens NRMC-F 0139]